MGTVPQGPQQNWPREGDVEWWWENGEKKYRHWEYGRWLPGVFTAPGAPTSSSTGPAGAAEVKPKVPTNYVVFTDDDLQEVAWENLVGKVWPAVDTSHTLSPLFNGPLFANFDSDMFYGNGNASKIFHYLVQQGNNSGNKYKFWGGEVNYYLEGLCFAAFHQSVGDTVNYIRTWKGLKITRASQAVFFWALLGWGDYPWYHQHRDDASVPDRGGDPVTGRRHYKNKGTIVHKYGSDYFDRTWNAAKNVDYAAYGYIIAPNAEDRRVR